MKINLLKYPLLYDCILLKQIKHYRLNLENKFLKEVRKPFFLLFL